MKKGLWKRRAFAFLVAAAMVIPQGVYAAETEGNETSENAITEEVSARVHENGCTLPSDHEGDCVTEPVENTEEPTERVHEEGCKLAPDHEGDCMTESAENTEQQPARVHVDGCILPSDHEGECEVEEMLVKAPLAAGTIYVANTAGTSGNIGSKENPYISLAKAVKEAADRTTIVVLKDMTIEEPITVEGKSIKIQSEESNRVTLTRGESMGTKNDGRGWYNPAMIEVTVPAGTSSASLTLENIILDDAGKKCGEYFAQPSTDWSGKTTLSYKEQGINKEIEVPNTNIVQDAIVAAYGTNVEQPNAEIVLGKGAVLKDFGGMSAVRVTGGATLTMKGDSIIYDEVVTDREKGKIGSFGPAGAVWVQGTHITMEQKSCIEHLYGRAIYAEGSDVTVDGIISNIASDKDMWNSTEGRAVYMRNPYDSANPDEKNKKFSPGRTCCD